MSLEQHARENIDRLLTAAGWLVCDADKVNIHAARGVAIREFPLRFGYGFADYLLYVDGKAAGVIEAKKVIVIPVTKINSHFVIVKGSSNSIFCAPR
ncbi:hypothetical protein [Nitrosomonas communis]|uniref:hypothetical protein n=1 Tax=Nitrosomonas communis TaxID=44574 RepID=UPI0026EA767E|nr:hypothetical protein [Nitrosomonas communis]MCO6428345.1 hypothetical protein [Nitrosomonas communis]